MSYLWQALVKDCVHYITQEHGLDYQRLLDSSSYKEQYRVEMMKWGEEVRSKDPGYFCQLAVQEATKPVWIICDARRLTDMEYFSIYPMLSTRVQASDEVRKSRGWQFVASVDDGESECGLDQYDCDIVINNNGDNKQLMADIKKLKDVVINKLKT